jgi:hypothetical protein
MFDPKRKLRRTCAIGDFVPRTKLFRHGMGDILMLPIYAATLRAVWRKYNTSRECGCGCSFDVVEWK